MFPVIFNTFWITNLTQAVVFAVVAASAGMLYGRVGLVSLGQVAPYGIGTWTTMRLAYATDLPWPALLIVGGIVAAIVGVLIGLPALRVSGLYLALVTLMLAAAIEILLFQLKFPNGGDRLQGGGRRPERASPPLPPPTRSPSPTPATSASSVVVALLLFMLATWFLANKPGRAWASIQQSEPAALAAGIDVTRYKIIAFALAALMAGVAGGLFAGSVQNSIGVDQFNRQAALFLIAAVLMGGIRSLWGALIAGFLAKVMLRHPGRPTWSADSSGTTSACRCSGSAS